MSKVLLMIRKAFWACKHGAQLLAECDPFWVVFDETGAVHSLHENEESAKVISARLHMKKYNDNPQ